MPLPKLLFLCLIVIGCSSSETPLRSFQPREVVVVHGDPLDLIANTVRSPQSQFNKELFDHSSLLVLPVTFARKTSLSNSSNQVSFANGENKLPEDKNIQDYFSRRVGEVQWVNGTEVKIQTADFSLSFKGEPLHLVEIHTKTGSSQLGRDFEPLHYSHNKEFNIFSVLVQLRDDTIINFNFSPAAPLPTPNSNFAHLIGPRRIPLPGSRTMIKFCHESELRFKDMTSQAIRIWNQGLATHHRLSMESAKCPPFSDVNTKGIYLIDSYMFTPLMGIDTGGVTISFYDLLRRTISDTDIFIMRSELYTKHGKENLKTMAYETEYERKSLTGIIIHELGHLLGLNHNMDDPSIMNYGYLTDRLYPYDIEAVKDLYAPK